MNLENHLQQPLDNMLKHLKLNAFEKSYQVLAEQFSQSNQTYVDYLRELAARETEDR